MVDCDMCGKKDISPIRAKVEGTTMTVCNNCVKYGERLADPSKSVNNFTSRSRPSRERVDPDANKFIVKNYGGIVKRARESRNLKQEELARQISEKESLIHKVESGSFKPSFRLAKKLERFLSVTLIEEVSGSVPENFQSGEKAEELTMEQLMLNALKKAKK